MQGYPKIYMPFKSLKGYDEYVKSKQIVPFIEVELMQDRIDELNYSISRIKVGDMISIVYKDHQHYIKKTGKVTHINLDLKQLYLVKTNIPINHVIKIEIEE